MAKSILLFTALTAFIAQETFALYPAVQQSIRSEIQDANNRQQVLSHNQRLLAACASKSGRKLREQNGKRRAAQLQELRTLRRLDATTVLAKSHKSNLTDVTVDTYPEYLFGDDDNVKCILSPETTETTFYVEGEIYRQNISETQSGIDLYTELQFIDINTCSPIPNLWVNFWHSNADGVYSGVVGSAAGESTEASNVNATFLRGLLQTDSYGLTGFNTIFPGHYDGRAPHINILAVQNGTYEDNNTYSGGLVIHVGELFFDQDLITTVRATEAYTNNTQNLTLNKDDAGLIQAAASGYDPIMEYALLGDTIESGVFAWISIGVDLTARNNISVAGEYTGSGGVQFR